MSATILLIEDEAPIREMVHFALTRAGFTLISAESGAIAQDLIAQKRPDLMLIDWMLPGITGIELVRRLKQDDYTHSIPVIMLTARSEEDDKIQGLDVGADDYVTKPFSPRELVARIRALLRRTQPTQENSTLTAGPLVLDTASHRVMAKDTPLNIGPTEFRLLQFLMQHPERVYTRTQLLDHVWSRSSYVEERTVDVHILRLRKLLAPVAADHMVQTVRGVGYRFSVGHHP